MGRMGKKKKTTKRRLSPIQKAILLILGFSMSFFLLIGFTNLTGPSKALDFAVRKRAKKVLDKAFPAYQVETIAANPKSEADNRLTVGYANKEIIRQSIQQNRVDQAYVNMRFNNFQLRIREFFISPLLILALLFLFTPIAWKIKLPGMLAGLLLLYGLLVLKLRAVMQFEINRVYFPDKEGLLQNIIPYFSSPGLVFLIVLVIWIGIILPFLDLKKLLSIIPDPKG